MKETQYSRISRTLAAVALNGGDVIKAAAEGIIRGDFVPAITDMILAENHGATDKQLDKVFDMVLDAKSK